MPPLKDVLEPLSIVVVFFFGTVVNRKTRRKAIPIDDGPILTPSSAEESLLQPRRYTDVAERARFHDTLLSRFLAYFPFLMEVLYWNLTYWVYQLARAASAALIRGNEAVFLTAQSHALSILNLETKLGIAIERNLQATVLARAPGLMALFRITYYSHITVGVLFLAYTYTSFPTPLFRTVRRTIAANNLIAFTILTLWRCMPPRMLPASYGYIDVLHAGPHSWWTENKFQLTIAAMPSLHFGTALFLSVCLCRWAPHRWIRWVAPLWPTLMLLTILSTANHFLLDALVGALIPALGWRINKIVMVLMPLEQMLFWICRAEKPRQASWDDHVKRADSGSSTIPRWSV